MFKPKNKNELDILRVVVKDLNRMALNKDEKKLLIQARGEMEEHEIESACGKVVPRGFAIKRMLANIKTFLIKLILKI